MKKIILATTLVSLTTLFAQSTMCYIQNITNPSQSEITPLNGGKCAGKKSAQDMQNDGWEINDIKISSSKTGMNYTFVFKKNSLSLDGSSSNLSEDELIAKIEAKMAKKLKNDKKKRKLLENKQKLIDGKAFYIKRCQSCHGVNAEKSAYNTSRPLVDMEFKEFKSRFSMYGRDMIQSRNAFVMTGISNSTSLPELEATYIYIESLKNKK